MLNSILYFGSKFFQKFPFLGNAIRTFYLNLLLPIYFRFISWKSSAKFKIVYRHSVLLKNFNPCLSDIDYSLVLLNPDGVVLDKLVSCLTKSYKLKILDIPQIYLKDEWDDLPDMDDPEMSIVRFFWYLRKHKWINNKHPSTDYEKFKIQKSNITIKSEIFKNQPDSVIKASDLKMSFPVTGGVEVCFYSPYLELYDSSRILICGFNEFQFLLSLLPFERPVVQLSKDWMKKKMDLWKFEYYISKSHYRVHLRMGEDCQKYKSILRDLESEFKLIFGESLKATGDTNDYTG